MKRSLFLRLLLLALTTLSATGTLVAADKKPKATIGVSLLTLTHPFFKDLGEALRAEAAKNGMEVVLTAGEFDPAKQRNQVADFIVRRVDAIVLAPCDSKAVGTVIAEANKAGIPVFTVDIAALAAGAKVVSHVATDNLSGGRLAAQAMIEALGGKGKVAIIDHPEVESVIQRTRGFEEELALQKKEKGVTMEVVTKLPSGGAMERAYKVAEDMLQTHPDLRGIFAINDYTALGAVAAVEKAGKTGQVVIVGFDGSPEGRRAIRDGKIYADPIQFPDRIGAEAVRGIVKYLAGDDVPPQVLIPTALYKKADAVKDASLK